VVPFKGFRNHTATTGSATNPGLASPRERSPAVHPIHFKDILEIKLCNSFAPVSHREETVILGAFTILTFERDRESQYYSGGMHLLPQPFESYTGSELQKALAHYLDPLYTFNKVNTFESVKAFHFPFH
jgi:hypothetical protein